MTASSRLGSQRQLALLIMIAGWSTATTIFQTRNPGDLIAASPVLEQVANMDFYKLML